MTLSSTTLFTTAGSQYAIKSVKTAFLHICFAAKAAITSGSVLTYGIPEGYRPTENINNYGAVAHDGSLVSFNITTEGKITLVTSSETQPPSAAMTSCMIVSLISI